VRIVVDASAAIEVALNRRGAAALIEALAVAEEVLAPDLFIAEVTNVIWKYHHFENLDLATCEQALAVAVQIPDALVCSRDLHREAFLLARSCGRAACDMFYLALAQREDASLVTLDGAFRKVAKKQSVRVL
jgi:predicted nucleic acid-binding protein